jgi:hypothetical protein
MVRQHPKFRGLSAVQLGSWLVLRSEAELRDGHCFADRADALTALRRRHTASAARMLDGLIALTLFDVQDDGSITVHDRSDHDRQSFPSDDPDEVLDPSSRWLCSHGQPLGVDCGACYADAEEST